MISPCFFTFTQKVIHPFPAHIFPELTMPGYPHKASYFESRCHNFSGKDQAGIIQIRWTDNNNFLCDRVCTLSKKLKEDILVAFWSGKCGLENGV